MAEAILTYLCVQNKNKIVIMEEQILIFRTSVKNVRDIKHISALSPYVPKSINGA